MVEFSPALEFTFSSQRIINTLLTDRHTNRQIAVAAIIFLGIAVFSPLVVDDFYFNSLKINGLLSKIETALFYGNGRFLGNLLNLLLLENNYLRWIVKAGTITGIILCVSKCTYKITGQYNSIFALLLLGMTPGIMATVVSWTSGFCNYVPPVLVMILCGWLLFFKTMSSPLWHIFLFMLGFSGQLFVEHSSLINLSVLIVILFYMVRERHANRRYVVSGLLGAALGTAAIFGLPRVLGTAKKLNGYQKLNLSGLRLFVTSVFANSMQIGQIFSKSIVLWLAVGLGLFMLLKKYRTERNELNSWDKICAGIVGMFPLYCTCFYLVECFVCKLDGIFYGFLNLCFLLVYYSAVIYLVIRMKSYINARLIIWAYILFCHCLLSIRLAREMFFMHIVLLRWERCCCIQTCRGNM